MGVQGLWKLVESTGRPVNLESLEGKVLAVDVSIWLNQAVLGVHGNGLNNPHLQVLFNRICKLLFYRIKPIFVFDGTPPQLKKQTLAARRERKNLAAAQTEKTTERIVKNYLKSHAIQAVIGENGEGTSKDLPPLHIPRKNETDLFELPPLPSNDHQEQDSESEDEEEENIAVVMAAHQAEMASTYQDLGEVDIESESFKAMPVEVQHELLSEIQESSKKNSWARMHQLPKESKDFSHYQMKKLLNKSKLSLRLGDLRKEMRTKMSLSMVALLDAQNESSQVEAGRVASEDTQHYILVKKGNKAEEASEEESEDEAVVASYGERAGFATSMDLKMEKARRKRGPATMATTSSSSSSSKGNGVEVVVVEDDSTPAMKRRKRDPVSGNMDDNVSLISDDKESKDEAVKAELKKFFDQLDTKLSSSKNQTGSSSAATPDVVIIDNISTSNTNTVLLSEPAPKLNSAKSESTRNAHGERTLADLVVVDDVSHESDFIEREKAEEEKHERLKIEMSSTSIKDHHPQERSKATEDERTSEISSVEFKTKEEKSGSAPSNSESMTRPLEHNGRTMEDITKMERVTIERKTTDDPMIVGPGEVIKEEDRATTQRRDILKELQKKKEDMKNMLKAFESRMEDFQIPDDPIADSAFDVEIVPEVGPETGSHEETDAEAETGRNVELDAGTTRQTCDDAGVKAKTLVGAVTDTTLSEAEIGAKNIVTTEHTAKAGTDREGDEKNAIDPGKRVVVEITLDRPVQGIGLKTETGPVDISDTSFMTRTSLDSEWTTSTQNQLDSDEDVQRIYMQESDQEPDIDEWHGVPVEKMVEMDKKLQIERLALEKERRKQQKKAYSITDTMYADSKEMLQCFGIPYIDSPQEAEAQCAFLDLTNQTEGTITDDSDIWLFGGCRVFRHFFSKKKDPEFFRGGDIERHLLLNRKKLINLAYLVGSDYTLGIQGIGSVGAMEILGEFKGQGINTLKAFKQWWSRTQDQVLPSSLNAIRSKWCKLVLPEEFPNPLIAQAYMKPVIDLSEEAFQWGLPDLGLLREFARERFGWMKTKVDENLLPVLKRLNEKQVQSKVTSFFSVSHHGSGKKIVSKRMRNALMQMERTSDEEEESEEEEEEEERPKKKKKVVPGSGKKRRVRRKKKVVSKPNQEEGEEKDKGVRKVKKRIKRKKKVVLNNDNDDTTHEPTQGMERPTETQVSGEEIDSAERAKVKRKTQNGKSKKPTPEPCRRRKRSVPQVDYAAMMDEDDEDIPDEVLLDVAEDMEMAALMEEAGSGHSVTQGLRNIGSSGSQPKTRSLNSSIDTDFVEESMSKGRGVRRGQVVPRLGGGGGGGGGRGRGKGKRGGGSNKGKALIKKRPVQMEGPKLSSSGTDSD